MQRTFLWTHQIFHLLPTFRFYLPMTFLIFPAFFFFWFPPRNVLLLFFFLSVQLSESPSEFFLEFFFFNLKKNDQTFQFFFFKKKQKKSFTRARVFECVSACVRVSVWVRTSVYNEIQHPQKDKKKWKKIQYSHHSFKWNFFLCLVSVTAVTAHSGNGAQMAD